MFPLGLKGFSTPIKLPDVELKPGGKQHVLVLQCRMGDAVYTVGKAPDPKPKKAWSEVGRLTGNMGGAPLKL
jgi:hypothetical protein